MSLGIGAPARRRRPRSSLLDEGRRVAGVLLLLLDRLLFLGRVLRLLLAFFRGLMGHGSLRWNAETMAPRHYRPKFRGAQIPAADWRATRSASPEPGATCRSIPTRRTSRFLFTSVPLRQSLRRKRWIAKDCAAGIGRGIVVHDSAGCGCCSLGPAGEAVSERIQPNAITGSWQIIFHAGSCRGHVPGRSHCFPGCVRRRGHRRGRRIWRRAFPTISAASSTRRLQHRRPRCVVRRWPRLRRMQIKIVETTRDGNKELIKARAADRDIEIEIEALTPNTTRLTVTAMQAGQPAPRQRHRHRDHPADRKAGWYSVSRTRMQGVKS